MIGRGTGGISPDRRLHLLQKEGMLTDGVVGDPEDFVKRSSVQPLLFRGAEGDYSLDEIALMKTGNPSPVVENWIARLFRKAPHRHPEHIVPSPLRYQSRKRLRRYQPLELKVSGFREAFRKCGFVLRRTNENPGDQAPDFEHPSGTSRHRASISIIRTLLVVKNPANSSHINPVTISRGEVRTSGRGWW